MAGSWWADREKFIGDVNGDGRDDIIALSGEVGQAIAVMTGQTDGTFAWATQTANGVAGNWWAGREKFVGDVNGDGRTDIVALGGEDKASGINLWFGQADATFTCTSQALDLIEGT